MDRQTDGQMFGHFTANRQMDRQTDGQTEFANFNIDIKVSLFCIIHGEPVDSHSSSTVVAFHCMLFLRIVIQRAKQGQDFMTKLCQQSIAICHI